MKRIWEVSRVGVIFISYVCTLQVVQGVLLLTSGAPIGITSVNVFERFPHLFVGAVFIGTAVAALVALRVKHRPYLTYGLLLPQQLVLLLMALRVVQAMVENQYAVGSPPGLAPSFIISDQAHVAVAFVFHLWAVSAIHLNPSADIARYQSIIEEAWKVIRERGLQ